MRTTFRELTAGERQLLAIALARGTPVSTAGLKIGDDASQPSCDWSHVDSRFKYLARDATGEAFFYTKRPEESEIRWMPGPYCEMQNAAVFASYQPGNCDWRDSLISRPELEK